MSHRSCINTVADSSEHSAVLPYHIIVILTIAMVRIVISSTTAYLSLLVTFAAAQTLNFTAVLEEFEVFQLRYDGSAVSPGPRPHEAERQLTWHYTHLLCSHSARIISLTQTTMRAVTLCPWVVPLTQSVNR